MLSSGYQLEMIFFFFLWKSWPCYLYDDRYQLVQFLQVLVTSMLPQQSRNGISSYATVDCAALVRWSVKFAFVVKYGRERLLKEIL